MNQVYNPTQAASGTAVTPTGNTFVTDQWQAIMSQASKLTFQQVSDAPAGLKYSQKISVASQFSPGATDQFTFIQQIEGQNIVDFQLGQAGAATIICSNWIKGSVAGTYAVSIRNGAVNRSYVGTVSVTTGWQRLTISLVGDTTGTWATDNTSGFTLGFDLGSGSNFNTTTGAWQAGNFLRTAGSVTFVNQVAGATLNITGAQVETVSAGATQPTMYEFLPYETQLRRAQRYLPSLSSTTTADAFAAGFVGTTTTAYGFVSWPVRPRVIPTGVVVSNAAHLSFENSVAYTASAVGITQASIVGALLALTITGGTANQGGAILFNNASGQLYFTGAQL